MNMTDEQSGRWEGRQKNPSSQNPRGSCEVPVRMLVASGRSGRGLRGVFSGPEMGSLGVRAYGRSGLPSWGSSLPHLKRELG